MVYPKRKRVGCLSLLLIGVFLCSNAYATAQRPNIIYIDGVRYSLCGDPLESYFKTYPERQPKNPSRVSDLWRGYIATFEIQEGMMSLKDIEAYKSTDMTTGKTEWRSVLADVVPGKNKLQIDWFTGLLVLPNGDIRMLDYTEYDCSLLYEGYIVVEINNGKFVRSKRINEFDKWMDFRERQFKAFRKTQDYKDLVKKMRDGDRREDSIDPVISDFILSYSKKILID